MTAGSPLVRSLLVYALCLPLAIFLGYLLAQPLDFTSLVLLLTIAGVIALPILLRYHHPLLILAINSNAVAFLLPGRPELWMLLCVISLTISIVQKTLLPGMKFLYVPSVFWSLVALGLVALFTAEMRGGISFRFMGGEAAGGRRYFELFMAILAYFALVSRPIPLARAGLYIGLFFLGAAFSAISSLANVMTHPVFNYIFLLFPPEVMPGEKAGAELGTIRFGGVGVAAIGAFAYMLAKYGLRGIFLAGKPLRLATLAVIAVLALFGGFRSMLILIALMFFFAFWLEGLFRTKLFPLLAVGAFFGILLASPFASRLPFTVQRAMAFVPFVEIDPIVRMNAQASTDWRVQMWKQVAPEVPDYLLLGKGYAMSSLDIEKTLLVNAFTRGSTSAMGSELASDYHNGPLTVIIPLGIWGALAFIWFIIAGIRVLHLNYRHGDPALKQYNTFLYAAFLAQLVLFMVVYGSLYSDLVNFTGLLGMSICLNNGVRHAPVRVLRQAEAPAESFGASQPALGRSL